jgi:hypothetical protein
MNLLQDALDAAGGLEHWRTLKRFTAHLSIKGALVSRKDEAGHLGEVVAEGCTQAQLVRLTGFMTPDKIGTYQPDRAAIESPNGVVLRERKDPRAAFRSRADHASWDDLDFVYFFGFSIWNYLTAPFLLTLPGVKARELPVWNEHGKTWRRLAVAIPPSIVTHSRAQTLYFDSTCLQRRLDSRAIEFQNAYIAHYSSAHQEFSGIVVPTLRRSMKLRSDRSAVEKPSLFDIEIFDARFE